MSDTALSSRFVLIGRITSPHGVKGAVKVESFAEEPRDIVEYGPLTTESGEMLELSVQGGHGHKLICMVAGVADRDAADSLRLTNLYVDRTLLPEPDVGQFYMNDLIGLEVKVNSQPMGVVASLQNYGASDLLNVEMPDGKTLLLPFTDDFIETVDVDGGLVEMLLPDGLLGESKDD